MTPIFDINKNVVAWLNEDSEKIFDVNMNWIAFLSREHAFSATSSDWLGPYVEGSFRDKSGKAVAWAKGRRPTSGLRTLTPLRPLLPLKPLRPLKPLTPLTPLTPLNPLGGWSAQSWDEWVNA